MTMSNSDISAYKLFKEEEHNLSRLSKERQVGREHKTDSQPSSYLSEKSFLKISDSCILRPPVKKTYLASGKKSESNLSNVSNAVINLNKTNKEDVTDDIPEIWPKYPIFIKCLDCNKKNYTIAKTILRDDMKLALIICIVLFPLIPIAILIYCMGCSWNIEHCCKTCNKIHGKSS